MKLFKWAYGAIALVATTFLIMSFFMQNATLGNQISLLIQSVGFGWVSGFAAGSDM